jgi:pimeloyl-ACP methyl ester carboxylesterase
MTPGVGGDSPHGPGAVVVLVHGLWHGTWVWDGVRELLEAVGVASVAVELPLTSLDADVAATLRVLDAIDGPAVLVGHSYGGAVITAAGVHPRVSQLLYLAAFQLDTGESVGRTLPDLDIPGTRLGEALRFSGIDDSVELDPKLAAEVMYADAEPEIAAAACARLRAVDRAVFRGVPAAISWRHRPSTFVVCAEDRAVHPDLQRAMAKRATHTVEWPCGHSPATTRPHEVAQLIQTLAAPSTTIQLAIDTDVR